MLTVNFKGMNPNPNKMKYRGDFLKFYLLILKRVRKWERERKREKHRFVVLLIYAFTG